MKLFRGGSGLVCPFLILKRNIESNGTGIVEPFSKKQKRDVALC